MRGNGRARARRGPAVRDAGGAARAGPRRRDQCLQRPGGVVHLERVDQRIIQPVRDRRDSRVEAVLIGRIALHAVAVNDHIRRATRLRGIERVVP